MLPHACFLLPGAKIRTKSLLPNSSCVQQQNVVSVLCFGRRCALPAIVCSGRREIQREEGAKGRSLIREVFRVDFYFYRYIVGIAHA